MQSAELHPLRSVRESLEYIPIRPDQFCAALRSIATCTAISAPPGTARRGSGLPGQSRLVARALIKHLHHRGTRSINNSHILRRTTSHRRRCRSSSCDRVAHAPPFQPLSYFARPHATSRVRSLAAMRLRHLALESPRSRVSKAYIEVSLRRPTMVDLP
jgi:hypothetical protein